MKRFYALSASGNDKKVKHDTDELFEISRKLRLVNESKWISGIWGDV